MLKWETSQKQSHSLPQSVLGLTVLAFVQLKNLFVLLLFMKKHYLNLKRAEERAANDQCFAKSWCQIDVTISKWTNGLVLHACEDNVEHLCECGLRSGLVDEVAAGQVDVVAGPDCKEHRALMDLYVRGGDSRQQGLDREREEEVKRYHTTHVQKMLLLHLLNHHSTSLLMLHVKATNVWFSSFSTVSNSAVWGLC